MKRRDTTTIFWGLLSVLWAAGIELLLIELALKEDKAHGPDRFVWFFPFGLMPLLSMVTLIALSRIPSGRQRKLVLRNMAIYLPCVGIPLAVQVYGGQTAQLWAWFVFLPAQILLPFWHSKNMERIAREESGLAAG